MLIGIPVQNVVICVPWSQTAGLEKLQLLNNDKTLLK